MTRRDFQLISRTLKDAKAHPFVCSKLAAVLAGTNPKFDRRRFMRESGAGKFDHQVHVDRQQEGAQAA